MWLGRHAFYTIIGREDDFGQLQCLFREKRGEPIDSRKELLAASKKALNSWSYNRPLIGAYRIKYFYVLLLYIST
jgi:hypothetical protein